MILQEAKSDLRVADVFLPQMVARAFGQQFKNHRVRDAIKPMSVRHMRASPETVAREPHMLDAELRGVLHQNAKNGRMQMQMQMAVDMVEWKAG